jgi:hypothetical protein
MPKSKFLVPTLLVVILILLALIGVLLFQNFNSTNSKKDILDRVDKLSSLEVDLMPINQGNYYQFQNPDSFNKIQLSLDRLEKGSNTAKKIFDDYNGKNLDRNSKNYIEQFNTNFAKFKSDKKEFDCLYQAYNEYSGQINMYSMGGNDPENSIKAIKTKLEEAKKCGLKLDEIKSEEMLANFNAMTDLSKNMQNQYQDLAIIPDKYTQPTPAQMEAQNQMSTKYGEVTNKFSNSLFEIVNSKYMPLIEYSRFIKSSQDNF